VNEFTLLATPAAARTASWRDYVTLTKPRIMALLVLTSVCALIAAAHGAPSLTALAALVVGGASACGGAGAFNHVLDRDIDRLMGERTASRPVAGRTDHPRTGRRLRLRALGALVRRAGDAHERAHGSARADRQPVSTWSSTPAG